MADTVVGVFDNVNHVETAIKQLHDAGIEKARISMVAATIAGNQSMHGIALAGVPATHGAVADVGFHATSQGLFRLLFGSAQIWIPGVGPVLALGPIALDVGEAMKGGGDRAVVDALISHGVGDQIAISYGEKIRQGRYLVVVSTDGETSAIVQHVLEDNGATTVDRH